MPFDISSISIPFASAGHGGSTTLWILGVLLAGIFFIPLIAKRVGLPVVVAEIMFGVALGDSGAQMIGNPAWLHQLAELGLVFLMFIAGLEIDFREILSRSRRDAVVALVIYVLSIGLALIAMVLLDFPIFLALIVSATGVGVVIPVLREVGHGSSRFGRLILLSSLISEFVTLLIVVVFKVVHKSGLSIELLSVVVVGVFFYIALTLLRAMIWWFPERFRILFEAHDPSETGMRFSLFLLALFVGVAVAVGLEHIVGAFLAGITLGALFPNRQVLDTKFLAMGFGFLIPMFFIQVGLRFNIPDLTDWAILQPFLILLVVSYVVRGLASSTLLFVGFSPRETVAGGLLVAAQLSLNIVAGTIALKEGIITQELYDSIILLAVVTSFLFPTMAKYLLLSSPVPGGDSESQADDDDLERFAVWSPYEESAHES